jgi:protein-L-isoaspartate(D-aspartate) O-methyltransferase
MPDFTARRTTMVDTQVRPSDVTKFPVIDAMLSVPREQFVPTAQREAAYVGGNLSVAEGRVMLEPRTLAKMLDALDIQNDEMVLDIGCALGYSAAVIAHIAEAVVAVEDDEDLVNEAHALLSDVGADNVIMHHAALTEGAPEHGPYDIISIQGAVEYLPENLLNQLKEGGRIVCLFMEGALGVVRVGYRLDGEITWRFSFNAGAPVLPGFEKHRAFTL